MSAALLSQRGTLGSQNQDAQTGSTKVTALRVIDHARKRVLREFQSTRGGWSYNRPGAKALLLGKKFSVLSALKEATLCCLAGSRDVRAGCSCPASFDEQVKPRLACEKSGRVYNQLLTSWLYEYPDLCIYNAAVICS